MPARDPQAVHRRRLRRSRGRARRATVTAAAFAGAAAVALPYAGLGLPDVAWAAAAGGTVAASVLRWRDDRALRALPVPPAVPGAPPTGPLLTGPLLTGTGRSAVVVAGQLAARFGARGSSAAPLLRRLDRAARAMAAVAERMGPAAAGLRTEAVHGERDLRAAAARLVAVDRAAAVAPDDTRAHLDEGARALRAGLTDGIAAYERLVAAAAECVAADTAADGPLTRRLVEATDALRGLAVGLAEASRISARWVHPSR
jgi:hypothetical protein